MIVHPSAGRLLLATLLTGLLCGCATPPATAVSGRDSAASGVLVALHGAWESGDWPAWRLAFAPEATISFNASGALSVAEAADHQIRLRRTVRAVGLPLPLDVQMSPAEDTAMTVHYRTTWQFDFADGQTVEVPASVTGRIELGRIVQFHMDWDTLPYVGAAASASGRANSVLDMLLAIGAADQN